tara:strand:+ start:550 stop:714 length:165 start_codon:yes stop_codon:yes gene_type:complete
MGDKRLTFYPPGGGEPIRANPEQKDHYLNNGYSLEPQGKTEKPKNDGKSIKKAK